MAVLAYFILILGFFLCVFFSFISVYSLWNRRIENYNDVGQKVVFLCVLICYLILSFVFIKRDFSFVAVSNYTDTFLPWYYALTAVWAGQEGSWLLWLLFITICGILFSRKKEFEILSNDTKNIYWSLFFLIQGFFFFILITYANPFLINPIPPKEGMGLNPLLMHPGMVFHPPALFLGYAGFTAPALILISSRISGFDKNILQLVRQWSLISWLFLTIGIVLGMWWSYYELGWGGYWAWDPVENASLIPWLCSTAVIHILIVSRRENSLERSSTLLLGLSLVSCFLATFLTRSGVINSLHAFGENSIGKPILFFTIDLLVLILVFTIFYPTKLNRDVSGMFSKNGLLILSSWIFLGLCMVILIGTFYPIISEILLKESKGVGQDFYNRIFLPIASFLTFLLCLCPWFKWKTEELKKQVIFFIIVFIIFDIILYFLGIRKLLVVFTISASITGLISILYFVFSYKYYSNIIEIGKWGIHIGVLIIAISIAISSGFKDKGEFIIAKSQHIDFNGYNIVYDDYQQNGLSDKEIGTYIFSVFKKDKLIGVLKPERIFFFNQNNMFSKVDVLKRFFDELYISVHQNTKDGILKIEIQKNPMVHWIWIGSIILCISGFILMFRNSYSKK